MKPPDELKELVAKLGRHWYSYGVHTVGTAWGVASSSDKNPPRWWVYAYTDEPDRLSRVLPHEVEGFPVMFKNITAAVMKR